MEPRSEPVSRTRAPTSIRQSSTACSSDSLMWNTVVSAFRSTLDSYPQTGDLATIGHLNLVTGDAIQTTTTTSNTRSATATTSHSNLTWFVDDLAGSHEFKGGLVYSDINFTSANCSTGTAGGVQCEPDVPGNCLQRHSTSTAISRTSGIRDSRPVPRSTKARTRPPSCRTRGEWCRTSPSSSACAMTSPSTTPTTAPRSPT